MNEGSMGKAAWFFAAASVLFCALAQRADAHPLSQGSLDVVVRSDRVDVRARVTDEEVSVTNMLAADPASSPAAGASDAAFQQHARYLAAHVRIVADGVQLVPKVVRVHPPRGGAAATNPQEQRVSYELEYRSEERRV